MFPRLGRFLVFVPVGAGLPQLFVRPEAEALVVVALGFEQLAEMGLAVDVSLQRGVVPQTADRGKPIIGSKSF